jgi:hypothetical protein
VKKPLKIKDGRATRAIRVPEKMSVVQSKATQKAPKKPLQGDKGAFERLLDAAIGVPATKK